MRTVCALVANKNKSLLVWALVLATLILFLTYLTAEAQNEKSIAPSDEFNIPSQNGKIGFAANGTFSNATFMNGTWNFADLVIDGSEPLSSFKVAVKNSNVTISSFRASSFRLRSARLRYIAEGKGEQTFNIGIAAGEGKWGVHPEWSVIVDNVWLGEGDGWKIAPDGTITVKGVAGNISIVHYAFLALSENDTNLSFYEQHSVSILTIASAAIITIIGTVIRFKTKKGRTDPIGVKSTIKLLRRKEDRRK